jgi:hypothetical protein
MDIHIAAHYMKVGYRIRRPHWESSQLPGKDMVCSLEDLLATDWELVLDGIVRYFPIAYDDRVEQ